MTEDAKAKPPAEDANVEKHDVAGWRERARSRFGCSPHLLAGALSGSKPGQTFTESQVESKVKAFAAKEYDA